MYQFTEIERSSPEVIPSNIRVKNFGEIYEVYHNEEASVQASRCIQCGNPYCSATGCPLSNHIPQWLQFIADKDLDLAFQISNESSPFPEILGRICPHDRLCEGACTLNDGHGAITIGSIEVSITERGFEQGMVPDIGTVSTDKTVAIIGSGPAGLSCATFLLRAGIKPVVYEKADQAGGLLIYGIPGFKLEKKAVSRRLRLLQEAGMELHLGVDIGKDVTFEELKKKHDAVFIGIGATEGKVLDYKGYNSDGIFMAVPFLTNIQKKILETPFDKKYDVTGKSVVVIGGGDTAMDCVRTSIREGAASVKCFYRRKEVHMPGSVKEVQAAKEEGVEFEFLRNPTKFLTNKEGDVIGAEFIQTQIEYKGDSARGKIVEVKGSEVHEMADVTILALGFNNEKLKFLTDNGIDTDEWGAILTNDQSETSVKGVFAGGDGVRGADLVVTAALDGRVAAHHIVEELLATSD